MPPIDWVPPPPRPGVAGSLDRFVGPGATRAELALQFGLAVAAGTAAAAYGASAGLNWTWLQIVVAGLLGFDVAGGIVTTATSSAKRWYHRAGQGIGEQLAFVGVHLIHLLLVSGLYLGLDIAWLAGAATLLLLAAAVILRVPLYLQRPVALALYASALLFSRYVLRQPPGLEWFLPLFYLKLFVGHLPVEAPFRPGSRQPTRRGDA